MQKHDRHALPACVPVPETGVGNLRHAVLGRNLRGDGDGSHRIGDGLAVCRLDRACAERCQAGSEPDGPEERARWAGAVGGMALAHRRSAPFSMPIFLFAAWLLQLAPFDRNNPGIGSEDLRHLADVLGLGRFHVVASAAGVSIASDFAFSYQDRLLSLTISSNSFGVRDGEIAKAAALIRPEGWEKMPAEFRELGPSYRAANPAGVKAWMELEHKALIGPEYRQTLRNEITQAKLKELKLPTLLIAGTADLSTPPSISRMIAAEIPNSRLSLMPEAGHSTYWEQPEIFNRAVLDFIGGQSK